MAAAPADPAELVARWASAEPAALAAEPAAHTREFHELVARAILEQALVDRDQAELLAERAEALARALGAPYLDARLERERGNLAYFAGRYEEALARYQAAAERLGALGEELEAGIAENASVQTLSLLGRYGEARAAAERARERFRRLGLARRLAQVDVNEANLLVRQDRFEAALALYERAQPVLAAEGDVRDLAAVLSNRAVCELGLGRFAEASAHYEAARAASLEHGLEVLAAQADYNVAYLSFLRGDYAEAVARYESVRPRCLALDDPYHAALCDLDQAEVALDVHLDEPAERLAERAAQAFDGLGLPYEAAKATCFLAVARARLGSLAEALADLERARAVFVAEHNPVWPALVDLYKALLLFAARRALEAYPLARAALHCFERSPLASKAALAGLLVARLDVALGRAEPALAACEAILVRLAEAPTTGLLAFLAHFVRAEAASALGQADTARAALEQAATELESVRSRLVVDELKIALLRDRQHVYERLFEACLRADPADLEAALHTVQRAKARSLLDLLSPPGEAPEPLRLRQLREHLHSLQRREEAEELRATGPDPERLGRLRHQTREREVELLTALAEEDGAHAEPDLGAPRQLAALRERLPANTQLLELFQAGGQIHACLLDAERLEVLPLAASADIARQLQLLRFQLSKFRLGPDYAGNFGERWRRGAEDVLAELGTLLLAPLGARLHAPHLLVAPHGFLHQVPFHALPYGGELLVVARTVSYTPSGSVLARLLETAPAPTAGALVLGVLDERLPQIAHEVEAVAAHLPGAEVHLGASATADALRTDGPGKRVIHLCAHGTYDGFDPGASALHLADGPLTARALAGLRLPAELVTLSGCGTGLSTVEAGDEALGLIRALLQAGARALVASLWDADDDSAARFMAAFYDHWAQGRSRAEALQGAILALRAERPHPYFWAPFQLVGDPR